MQRVSRVESIYSGSSRRAQPTIDMTARVNPFQTPSGGHRADGIDYEQPLQNPLMGQLLVPDLAHSSRYFEQHLGGIGLGECHPQYSVSHNAAPTLLPLQQASAASGNQFSDPVHCWGFTERASQPPQPAAHPDGMHRQPLSASPTSTVPTGVGVAAATIAEGEAPGLSSDRLLTAGTVAVPFSRSRQSRNDGGRNVTETNGGEEPNKQSCKRGRPRLSDGARMKVGYICC